MYKPGERPADLKQTMVEEEQTPTPEVVA